MYCGGLAFCLTTPKVSEDLPGPQNRVRIQNLQTLPRDQQADFVFSFYFSGNDS